MKKIHFIFIFILLLSAGVQGKTVIRFKLPAAANLNYCFALEKGSARDTVAKGAFDAQGNARISLPKDYRGVAKLLFDGNKKPMLNMIVNGEKSVTVSSQRDDLDSLTYTHSPENETLQRFIRQQNELPSQYASVLSHERDLIIPDIRKQQLEQDYDNLSAEITTTPLYAGRIMQILRYLTSAGSSLKQTADEAKEELNRFFVRELNFNDLYVSGFWTMMFNVWYENNISEDDSLLVADARTMLNRTADKEMNRTLTQAVINTLSRYSRREYLLPPIFSDIKYPVIGQPAPDIITGTDSIKPRNALIMFYESDCGNCQNELHQLIEKYDLLRDNHVRVITVSADTDKDLFEYMAQKMVWQDNYCDFKGFDGVNFINYGVAGTPTFILIDKEGIVRGRYARMSEIINQ